MPSNAPSLPGSRQPVTSVGVKVPRPGATCRTTIGWHICVILCAATLFIVVEQSQAGEANDAPVATATQVAATAVLTRQTANGAASIRPSAYMLFDSSRFNDESTSDSTETSGSLELRTIGELGVNIAIQPFDDQGRKLLMPPDVTAKWSPAAAVPDGPRPWPILGYHWQATQLCHRPLYFEEINLERYGHSLGCAQPLLSAAHFYGTVAVMPVKFVLEPPCQCVYTLGHFRPGSCVPFEVYHPRPRSDRKVVTHCCFGKYQPFSKLWDDDLWDEFF